MRTLAFKVGITVKYGHDISVVIANDGEIEYGVEDERITRRKHGSHSFPKETIEHSLDELGIQLSDIDKIIIPYNPDEEISSLIKNVRSRAYSSEFGIRGLYSLVKNISREVDKSLQFKMALESHLEHNLATISNNVPEIDFINHHNAHAISAFYLSPFKSGLVITSDGRGETDSTVVWQADESGLYRVETKEWPNSLGHFFGAITEYLGFRKNNGEGKVMGLAPYGEPDSELKEKIVASCPLYRPRHVQIRGNRRGVRQNQYIT